MSQEFESGAKQSLKTFTADINQALQSDLLGFNEAIEFSTALGVVKARLDGHRNSFVPINKLPAEILARIFEFVIAPEPFRDPSDWPASIPPQEATWGRRLVFVCTRWCTIATKCQRMWYTIVDKDIHSSNDSPQSVLRRSGSTVPLHLYMTSDPKHTTASVCRWVTTNQPLRVEALFLQLNHDSLAKTILESLATPLPSLRLLSVDGTWRCRDVLADKMPAILGGGALGLRALMWSLSIPFIPGNAFPNLADLNITFSDKDVPNLDRLLRLLSNCPRLETLNLKQSSFDVATGIAPDQRPVALDHLRALWIRSMPINAALTTLAHLQLPPDATVRLSELTRYPPEPVPPRTPIPFLQQMNNLTRLDLVASKGRLQPFFHLIAVGTHSRFWIHFDLDAAGVGSARAYVRHICGMLPKKNLRTLRVAVVDIADLVVIRDALLGPLPSLDTLLMRHSTTAYHAEAPSGVAAVSKALCPGGGPEDTVKDSDTDSDEYVPDDGSTESASSSGTDSDGDSGDGSDDGDPTDAVEFPIDISAEVPAPHLKVVGLQVKCGGETASFKSFIRMLEARKQSGHPLDTVLCSFEWVDANDVDSMREHVVGGVHDVRDALWVPTIDDGWRVRNDYWRLYPERRDDCNEADYLEWGFFMAIW